VRAAPIKSPSQAGFSLVEMLAAVAILTSTSALFFCFAGTGQRLARSQPDAADVQQRLRVAVARLQRDLRMAGSGMLHGNPGGPLANYLPPIVPARTGSQSPDRELSWYPDRISIAYVPAGGWHTRLTADMAHGSADIPIDGDFAGCPGSGICGFVEGSRAAIIDASALGAGYDLFSVTGTTGNLAHGPPNLPFGLAYTAATAVVIPVIHRVYYLDRANRRLMIYDGHVTDLPLVDDVVDLRFAYYADPNPASVARPPPGESNCAYGPGDPPAPLLADFGGVTPRLLTGSQVTDGPVCGVSPNRFDADLLRIRRVRVSIRVQVASAELRGSGSAFVHSGFSDSSHSYVPDYEVTFEVAPRNLHSTR
jgi:prepilin-type N-terminal cleavage/methylation domain-containing protein